MTMIRRLILAAALIAGIAPAVAQVPPPVPALPDTERRTSYSITASTCSCNVNFALYGDGTDYQNWVEVFLNGARVNFNDPSFGWVIAPASGSFSSLARPVTNAVLTFNAPQTGTVQIVGARRPRRLAQFNENTGVPARNLNQVFSDIISQNREIWDKTNDVTGRALMSRPGNTIGLLPSPSVCASALLGFDGSGLNPLCLSSGGAGNVILPTTAGNLACFTDTTGRLQNCDGLSLVLSQNAPTAAFITNTNPGNAALAVWSATNANGSASFGVGGANYSIVPILQNRTYVDAQSALGGIAINNQGANPIVFGIGNSEVARFTGTKGLTLAPAFQPANIGNAAVYSQLANPANGYTTLYNGAQFSVGTPIPASEQYGNNVIAIQQALVATGVVAAGDLGFGNILSGYCRTDAPDPAICVGVLGQSGTSVNNSSVFGFDFIAQNIHAPSTAGFDMNYISGGEVDSNLWQKSPGVNPSVNGPAGDAHFYGLNIKGGGNHTNEIGSGIVIDNSAFPGTTRWANGLRLNPGCCVTGVFFGPVALGNSQSSQPAVFTGTNSGGLARSGQMQADLDGNLVIKPFTAGIIALADPSTGTLFATSTSFGGSGVKVVGLATGGVVTNTSAGLIGTLPGTTATVLHGNASGSPSFGAVDLTAEVTNSLPAVNGGTGQTAYVLGDTLYSPSANTLFRLPGNTTSTKQFLSQTGTGTVSAVPVWSAVSASDITGLGTGIATFLATPTSANLRAALTDEVGTGAAYFVGGALGTPASGTATNLTGLPTTGLTGTLQAAQFPALTGDITTAGGALTTTLATVNSNVGTFGSATQAPQVTVNGKGLITAVSNVTITPAIGSVTGIGTGVAAVLAINIGSAGSPVLLNGALGTPSSGTVTNLTGTASININGTVGATTPGTGAFTTLSASSTVSGTGFSTYLASPPAIGGTAAAAGTFTTLAGTTSVTSPLHYGGSSAGSTATLNGTSNGSPSSAYVLLQSGTTQFVGINSASPKTTLDVNVNTASSPALVVSTSVARMQSADAANGGMEWVSYGSGSGNFLTGAVAGGTSASPTATPANRSMFNLSGWGWNGTAWAKGAIIAMQAPSLWSGVNQATQIDFYTTPASSTTIALAASFLSGGGFLVGSGSGPAAGQVAAQNGFIANNLAGLSTTKTVRASGGAADCTLIYTGGILTGGSC